MLFRLDVPLIFERKPLRCYLYKEVHMKNRITLVFILLVPSFSITAKELDIFKIFNQFTAVSAASGKCIEPSSEELTSFLANYQMVTTLMHQKIKSRKPEWSDDKVSQFIEKGSNKITVKIKGLINSEGCDSPKIQALTNRFYVQAKWKP